MSRKRKQKKQEFGENLSDCVLNLLPISKYSQGKRKQKKQEFGENLSDCVLNLLPISKYPVRFSGHKSYDSENKSCSNSHMTSCWSLDQRIMWLKR